MILNLFFDIFWCRFLKKTSKFKTPLQVPPKPIANEYLTVVSKIPHHDSPFSAFPNLLGLDYLLPFPSRVAMKNPKGGKYAKDSRPVLLLFCRYLTSDVLECVIAIINSHEFHIFLQNLFTKMKNWVSSSLMRLAGEKIGAKFLRNSEWECSGRSEQREGRRNANGA